MKTRIVQKPINYEHLFIEYIEREIFIQKKQLKKKDVKYYTIQTTYLTYRKNLKEFLNEEDLKGHF